MNANKYVFITVSTVILNAFTTLAQSWQNNGLIAYYPLNATTNDFSGNNFHLFNNGATYGIDNTGNANGAAYFNSGSATPPFADFNNGFGGQWMSFQSSSPIENHTNLSVALWLKPGPFLPPAGGNAAASRILYQERLIGIIQQGNSPQGFAFFLGNGTTWLPNGPFVTNNTLGFSTGTWVHCVYTYDSTGQRLFANGELVITSTNVFTGTGANAFTLGLGAYYNGAVKNLRFYDRVLTPGEVHHMYIIESGPPHLGISAYGNSAVLFFPSNPGTNFSLQYTTNLASSEWVALSNVVPFSAFQVTNALSNAYFRLNY